MPFGDPIQKKYMGLSKIIKDMEDVGARFDFFCSSDTVEQLHSRT